MVSLHADSLCSEKNDASPIEEQDPAKPEDQASLTTFQRYCLKSQPLMLYVVSMAQFLDI
ncbi:hypothetical protein BGZ98_009043, partial [Dissophora globulifera]